MVKTVSREIGVPRISTMILVIIVGALATVFLTELFRPQPLVLTPDQDYHVRMIRAEIRAGKPLKNAIVELRGGAYALITNVAADRSYMRLQLFHRPYGSEVNPAYNDLEYVIRTDNTSWMYEIKDVVYPGDKDYPKAREKLLPAD